MLAILEDFKNEAPETIVAKVLERLRATSQDITKLQQEILLNIETDVMCQRGKEEERRKVIAEMLRDGALSLEKIAAYAHVTMDDVKKLQQQLNEGCYD